MTKYEQKLQCPHGRSEPCPSCRFEAALSVVIAVDRDGEALERFKNALLDHLRAALRNKATAGEHDRRRHGGLSANKVELHDPDIDRRVRELRFLLSCSPEQGRAEGDDQSKLLPNSEGWHHQEGQPSGGLMPRRSEGGRDE